MKSIKDISFKGRKVLLRVDFNVPVDENKNITDDTRMRESMPTINKLLADGAAVIIMAHFGRPKKGGFEPEFTLEPVAKHLEELTGRPVKFTQALLGSGEPEAMAAALTDGEVMLLENIRFYPGETKGDVAFAEQLAKLGDCYINDAFGTAHRAHGSTALIAEYFPNDKMFGYLMEGEIKAIDNVLKNAQRPLTAIIGGSKVSSKLAVLKNLVGKVDNLIIGGGMGYTFIKAQGGHIGLSLHEDELIPDALEIMKEAKERGVNLSLSVATVCGQTFDNDTPRKVFPITEIPDDWEGMDAAPASLENWKKIILSSKTILWNGPVGVFELPNFAKGTLQIAEDLAEATKNGAYTLVGGGDSVAAVTQMGYADKVSYVSTGGGAMLEAIEGKVLPGIAAIQD